eukprot:103786-Pyramimonas_sp.AAC.1
MPRRSHSDVSKDGSRDLTAKTFLLRLLELRCGVADQIRRFTKPCSDGPKPLARGSSRTGRSETTAVRKACGRPCADVPAASHTFVFSGAIQRPTTASRAARTSCEAVSCAAGPTTLMSSA